MQVMGCKRSTRIQVVRWDFDACGDQSAGSASDGAPDQSRCTLADYGLTLRLRLFRLAQGALITNEFQSHPCCAAVQCRIECPAGLPSTTVDHIFGRLTSSCSELNRRVILSMAKPTSATSLSRSLSVYTVRSKYPPISTKSPGWIAVGVVSMIWPLVSCLRNLGPSRTRQSLDILRNLPLGSSPRGIK